jgi:CheY-like chemotaxis protein
VTKAAPIKILHVEDDVNDVLLFQQACGKANVGFEIQSVADGDEAIAYLRGAEKFSDRAEFPMPQLILLDLKMPRLSGFDVLEWVRQQVAFEKMPIIVLTSSNHDIDVRRAYDLGANSYLVKPVGFEGLVEIAQTVHSLMAKLGERPRA